MSHRKAILTCISAIAFLIAVRLSFAQAPTISTPVGGYLLSPQQAPWSVAAYERYETLKPIP